MKHGMLEKLRKSMIRRNVANVLLWIVPLLAAIFLLTRLTSTRVVLAAALLAIVLLVVRLIQALRSVDLGDVVRKLDASSPTLEDSADLLLDPATHRTPLQTLQRERVRATIETAAMVDLRAAWKWRVAFLVAGILLSLSMLTIFLPKSLSLPNAQSEVPLPSAAQPEVTRLSSSQLEIKAPAYTGLSDRNELVLDAKFAEGSRLHWRLVFDPQPTSASLLFHDGSKLVLRQDDAGWIAEKVLSESALYRIAIESAAPLAEDRLFRLDAMVDQPPEIRVIQPDKTLSMVELDQQSWMLEFEVSDDFAIADARLAITLAQGSGEQVTVSERSERLRADASTDPRRQRYRRNLDLASLGYSAGDDLIIRLIVRDKREPSANTSRSASYILRWPPEMSAESDGVEGIVQKVLPAYFRSQRQIIIDSEALIDERKTLSDDRFLARSDSIGVDQKILRLRYGQFLGEEFESGAAEHQKKGKDDEKASQQDALVEDHGHQQDATTATTFGNETNILAEYGHTHDHAGAATLLDPETKKILKAALAEMWQAELHLRLGKPREALPNENRALILIKQVQQSTRIYLARVGLELPPVDPSRRLSGERKGVADPRGVLVDSEPGDKVIANIYKQLAEKSAVDLDAFDAWLRGEGAKRADALSLIASIDALRREPTCADCRNHLLDQLWQAMSPPPVATKLRSPPDVAGLEYLDKIESDVHR